MHLKEAYKEQCESFIEEISKLSVNMNDRFQEMWGESDKHRRMLEAHNDSVSVHAEAIAELELNMS